ncbi:MAG: hypothetical protein IPM92_04375 [Saprospiraceae bacterium]|nr:hypothetical protein [Saprospiraceae bacterium]
MKMNRHLFKMEHPLFCHEGTKAQRTTKKFKGCRLEYGLWSIDYGVWSMDYGVTT